MNWTDVVTALSTFGLLIATGGLAVVAWVQISAARKSAREIFARQSRQEFLALSIAHPHLAARQFDINDHEAREQYFAYLSLLSSTIDDCAEFLADSEDFVWSMITGELTSHMLFIASQGISDWRFHFSKKALGVIVGQMDGVIQMTSNRLAERDDEAEKIRADLRDFGLEDWISAVDAITAGLEERVRATFLRFEIGQDVQALDRDANAALRARESFADLSDGQRNMVRKYLANRKSAQMCRVSGEATKQTAEILKTKVGYGSSVEADTDE